MPEKIYFPTYGESDTHGVGLDIRVEEGYATPKTIWQNRETYAQAEEASKEQWNTMMTDKQKEIVQVMTKNALGRIYDRVDVVIPSSFHAEPGKYLDITMRFLYSDIDEENERQLEGNDLLTAQTEQEVTEMFVEGGSYTLINIIKEDGSYSSARVSTDLADETIQFFTEVKGWIAAIAED